MNYMNGILGDVVNYSSPDYQRTVSPAEQEEILKRERSTRQGYRPSAAARDFALQKKYIDSANYTANALGKDVRTGLGALGEGAQYVGTNVTNPMYKGLYDGTADLGQGAVDFTRGVLGRDEQQVEGFRYRDQKQPQVTPDGTPNVNPNYMGMPQGALTQWAMDANTPSDSPYHTEFPPAPNPLDDSITPAQQSIGVLAPGNTGQALDSDTTGQALDSELTPETDPALTAKPAAGILEKVGEAASVNQTGTTTSNKRDNTGLSVPKNRINLAEGLIRVGGAITGASGKGALAAIGAGTTAFGGIADENRALEMAQYEADQAAYESEEGRKISRMQARGLSAAQQKNAYTTEQAIAKSAASVGRYDSLINDLTSAGNNVSGWLDGTVGSFIDKATGNPNANLRLRMQQVRVDEALKNVAETKGAISDREMTLFLSPMPTMTDSEEVWIDWMTMQRNLASVLNTRLSGAMNADGTMSSPTASDQALSAELQAYADKYASETDALVSKYN